MKVLLLSRYGALGASSRYRHYQYLPYLRQQGFEIVVQPLLDDTYLQRLYAKQPLDRLALVRAYLRRIAALLRRGTFDLVWIEKEALPWVPASLELLLIGGRVPYVVDYDDAWFHRYDQHRVALIRRLLAQKIGRVMQHAALVVAGNAYLAQRAEQAGARWIEQLPTVIDLHRYPLTPPPVQPVMTIGWIGSPSTARYLHEIQPALSEVCRDGAARVVAIGAGRLELPDVPLTVVPWQDATEVAELQQCDVGIMPLLDSPWERGKCGFKLIQYMACSRPVVGSPVGVNRDIIRDGVNGFHAETYAQWVRALETLKQDRGLRQRMGQAGRARVEAEFCVQVTAPRLAQLLQSAAQPAAQRRLA